VANLPSDVRASINTQLNKEIGRKVLSMVQKRFKVVKEQMLDEFENHKITVEIESGPRGSNSSQTLGGYGNLWSFIGFPQKYDPLGVVRRMLNNTNIRIVGTNKSGAWNFITNEPSREDLFAATKFSNFRDEFDGARSWLDGIETGISGLGSYLFDLKGGFANASRSGTGIELGGGKKSEKAFGSGDTGGAISPQRSRFTRTAYISSILKNFKKHVLALQREVI
jgi:hypothetical protein